MTQTLAILLDSIRALRSRYLFWISLGISLLASVTLFGMIGFDEHGWKVLWFKTNEHELYRAGTPESRDLMAFIFNSFYVKWWLSWVAIVLALISTASILPDFLASGSIDLALSKPISRFKLIGLKIVGALAFVVTQVAAGVTLAWLLIGVKVGFWLNAAFWAIPLITLQFTYLYAVSALTAVLTRSTLASLLATLLFWATCSVVQFSANQLDSNIAQSESLVADYGRIAESLRHRAEASGTPLTFQEESRLSFLDDQCREFRSNAGSLRPWRASVSRVEMMLPKTADLQKVLANMTRAPGFGEILDRSGVLEQQLETIGIRDPEELAAMRRAARAGQDAIRDVSAGRSIASSLLMPVAALIAALVIFWRRDY